MTTKKRPLPRHLHLPPGVEVLVSPPPYEVCTLVDRLLVYASSLIVVGSPVWFYGGIIYLYRKWKKYRSLAAATEAARHESGGGGASSTVRCRGTRQRTSSDDGNYTSSTGESSQEMNEQETQTQSHRQQTEQYNNYKRLATRYGVALAAIILISIWGPHRDKRVGEWLGVKKWRLWDAWLNYVGFTVLKDSGDDDHTIIQTNPHSAIPNQEEFDIHTSPSIFAFVPHGIFPFGLAFSCLPERGHEQTWGLFRPVVATATKLFPLVRTFISWMNGVDASRSAVSRALAPPYTSDHPGRVGVSPGGIAEMFETYPKPGFHPNDEAALLKDRNGLFKLAMKHKLPIVPVYCFGATKMLRRVQLPAFVETLSRMLKISLCLFFGKLGLPIPFRQRLMYVMGKTLFPPLPRDGVNTSMMEGGEEFDERVQEMHDAFCNEITRIFERNKDHYGWGNKNLRLV